MIRGTTPTITYMVDMDLTSATEMYLTFAQAGRTRIEKTLSDLTITADSVEVELTQLETLKLRNCVPVEMQFRGIVDSKAIASNIMKTTAERILKEGVI